MIKQNGRFSKGLHELSRRDFLAMAGIGAGALGLGGCGALGSRDEGGGLNAGTSGVKEYTFDVVPQEVDIGGRTFPTWGYDGGLPGPEIRIGQGDTLCVRLTIGCPKTQPSTGTDSR